MNESLLKLMNEFSGPGVHHQLPDDPEAPRRARRLLTDWLNAHHWPGQASNDLVLAVHEAVANAAEHAYRTTASATTDTDLGSGDQIGQFIDLAITEITTGPHQHRHVAVAVDVTDHGTWKPTASAGDRGRGLRLIRALTDTVQIEHQRGGTRLTLLSRAVEPPPR